MLYVPSHIEWLNNNLGICGYPKQLTEEGIKFAENCIKLGFKKYDNKLTLRTAEDCIFEGLVTKEPLPECLNFSKHWDFRRAVTFRALLGVEAEETWVPTYRTFPEEFIAKCKAEEKLDKQKKRTQKLVDKYNSLIRKSDTVRVIEGKSTGVVTGKSKDGKRLIILWQDGSITKPIDGEVALT